jgi:hypothetical protein
MGIMLITLSTKFENGENCRKIFLFFANRHKVLANK